MKLKRKCIALLLAVVLILVAVPVISPMTQFDSAKAAYTVEAASKVYYAKHSKKYHRTKHCRTLARSKHVYKCSKKKAKKMGLKKCKVCW